MLRRTYAPARSPTKFAHGGGWCNRSQAGSAGHSCPVGSRPLAASRLASIIAGGVATTARRTPQASSHAVCAARPSLPGYPCLDILAWMDAGLRGTSNRTRCTSIAPQPPAERETARRRLPGIRIGGRDSTVCAMRRYRLARASLAVRGAGCAPPGRQNAPRSRTSAKRPGDRSNGPNRHREQPQGFPLPHHRTYPSRTAPAQAATSRCPRRPVPTSCAESRDTASARVGDRRIGPTGAGHRGAARFAERATGPAAGPDPGHRFPGSRNRA